MTPGTCTRRFDGMLREAGLSATDNRRAVLQVLHAGAGPLAAPEIHQAAARVHPMNRTTVYRILDLFVARRLAERVSSGDRAFRYGVGGGPEHARHPHFYCRHCGDMACLESGEVHVEMEELLRRFSGVIERIEVRMDGICENCLRNAK